MKKRVAGALFAIATCVAGEANADEWYGYQTLASDGATVVATVAASNAFKSSTPAVVVGATGYLAAPVTIHLLHGEPVRAIGSGALRLGAPLVLGLAGALIMSEKDNGVFTAIAGAAGALIGVSIGVLVASVVDAGALAYETKDEPPASSTAQPLQTISIGGSF